MLPFTLLYDIRCILQKISKFSAQDILSYDDVGVLYAALELASLYSTCV